MITRRWSRSSLKWGIPTPCPHTALCMLPLDQVPFWSAPKALHGGCGLVTMRTAHIVAILGLPPDQLIWMHSWCNLHLQWRIGEGGGLLYPSWETSTNLGIEPGEDRILSGVKGQRIHPTKHPFSLWQLSSIAWRWAVIPDNPRVPSLNLLQEFSVSSLHSICSIYFWTSKELVWYSG